jgi:hypothetical protein
MERMYVLVYVDTLICSSALSSPSASLHYSTWTDTRNSENGRGRRKIVDLREVECDTVSINADTIKYSKNTIFL